MQTITVIIRDNYDGYHDPLIYTVDVPNLEHETVLWAVSEARLADLGRPCLPRDLDILFAFCGDLTTVADWRE